MALGFAFALGPARAGLPYELGQGYPLPWLGLTAGGYATLRAGNLEGEPAKAVVKDLSLFLHTDLGPRWHFFTELELGDPMAWSRDGLTTSYAEFDVERLYVDHNLTPGATLRLGKFLTPVGRWNLIHADPLVWSVFRPLTTSAAFARHASGISLLGTLPLADSSLDYQVYRRRLPRPGHSPRLRADLPGGPGHPQSGQRLRPRGAGCGCTTGPSTTPCRSASRQPASP